MSVDSASARTTIISPSTAISRLTWRLCKKTNMKKGKKPSPNAVHDRQRDVCRKTTCVRGEWRGEEAVRLSPDIRWWSPRRFGTPLMDSGTLWTPSRPSGRSCVGCYCAGSDVAAATRSASVWQPSSVRPRTSGTGTAWPRSPPSRALRR